MQKPKDVKMTTFSKQRALKSFIAGFQWKPAPKQEVETVEALAKEMKRQENNREMWRTCNSCGDHFDAIKTRELRCPTCGSRDLRIG